MEKKKWRVLDQYRQDSNYADEIGKRYHFPKKYYKLLNSPDIQFVYYEPKKKGKGEYFGCGEIGNISLDPDNPEQFFAEIVRYLPFATPVPGSDQEGRRRESEPYYNAQNAVRNVDPHVFGAICVDGG